MTSAPWHAAHHRTTGITSTLSTADRRDVTAGYRQGKLHDRVTERDVSTAHVAVKAFRMRRA
jgi:hypothetical protein